MHVLSVHGSLNSLLCAVALSSTRQHDDHVDPQLTLNTRTRNWSSCVDLEDNTTNTNDETVGSGVPHEARPVVPVTTGSPRLSLRARCASHCPVLALPQSHRVPTPRLTLRQLLRTVLFGMPARGDERAPVLFSDDGPSRVSSLTTLEAAGSLCVSSACEQVNL